MKKTLAVCVAIITGFIISGCDREELFELAKNGLLTATPVFNPGPGAYLTADGFPGQVEISCATEGAVIVYTSETSGATPPDPEYDINTGTVVTGSLYTEGVPVYVPAPGTAIIKARAYAAGTGVSQIAYGEYLVDQTIATPYFNHTAGAYTEPIDVEIYCDTPGVTIRYTTGEYEYPSETTGIVYTGGSVRISQPTYLRAIAYRAGMVPTSTEAYYDVQTAIPTVATPYFSHPEGTYYDPFDAEIYCDTSGADIYYSFDNVSYTLYTGALPISTTTTLYAYAQAAGMNTSTTAQVNYTLGERTVSFTAASQTSPESKNPPTLTVTMQLSSISVDPVNVPFTIGGTATQSADYWISPASELVIAAGSNTGTITVTLNNDTSFEGVETIVLTMGTPTNATRGAITGHTITITDDDTTPVVGFAASTSSISEPASGSANHFITINLNGNTSLPASVDYAVTAGTATNGSDYTLTSGTLNFSVGEPSKTIMPYIYYDALTEGDETFTITLSNPINAQLGAVTHTVTINDNVTARWVAVGNNMAVYSPDGETWFVGSNYNGVLRSVAADGAGNMVAVGDGGMVNNSSDGKIWTNFAPLAGNYRAVCTNNAGTWLAVGEAGTYRRSSIDNGASWAQLSQIATTNYGCAYSGSTWYASGAGGNVYTTTDYAGTWNTYTPGALDFNAIDVNGSISVAVGAYGDIAYSTDGGGTWNPSSAGSYTFNSVAIDSSGNCVAVGEMGTIYYTSDPGGTWMAASVNPFASYTLNSVACNSTGEWIVVGQGGKIGKSTDNGATWAIKSSPTTADLYSVSPR